MNRAVWRYYFSIWAKSIMQVTIRLMENSTFVRAVILAVVMLAGSIPASSLGQAPATKEKPVAEEARVPIAKCTSSAGTLVELPRGKKAWQVLRPADTVFSTDLLLALPGQQA